VSARVRLLAGDAPLKTIFETETSRRRYLIKQNGSAVASLSLDSTSVLAPGRSGPTLQRAAIESLDGAGLEGIQKLVDALSTGCKLTPAAESTFAASLRATGSSPEAAFDFGYAELYPDAIAGEYAYASLRRWFAAFLRHEPGTRLGEDPEELHDMRVAARRLRSIMGVFRRVLPMRFEAIREELRWISGELGAVRDLDVRLGWLSKVQAGSDWQEDISIGPLVEDTQQARAAARARLLSSLGSDQYETLLDAMGSALRAGETSGPAAAIPVLAYAQKTLRKRYRAYRRLARDLRPDSPVAAYHAVRIAGKRLRYSVECFEAILPKDGRRLVRATRRAQDHLGEHQDGAVTVQWLLDSANRNEPYPAPTLLRMGELLAQHRSRMAELRESWPEVHDDVRSGWRILRKALQAEAKQATAEDKPGPVAEKPVQRPFGLLQRFLTRTKRQKA
jgi:CHAD domain-containing protein